jgi:hypothetical protein
MPAVEFYRGTWGNIYLAIQRDGTSLADAFIKGLDNSDRLKLLALLKRAADMGPMNIHDGEKFKKLDGTLFEFKVFQIRMPCFYDGRKVILTHGFTKKKDKTPPAEIERAARIQKEYREADADPSKPKKKR